MVSILMKGGDAQMAVNQIDEVVLDVDETYVAVEGKTSKNRVGRPNVGKDEIILTNGFSQKQWDWIKKEAKAKHIHAAQYQRFIMDCYIDSVEASRTGPTATITDDRKYERLIKQTKSRKSKTNSNKLKRRK